MSMSGPVSARPQGPRPWCIYLHGVREVELFRRATELLPGLELRHGGGPRQERELGGQARPGPRAVRPGRPHQPGDLPTARSRRRLKPGFTPPKMVVPPRSNATRHWTPPFALAQ